MSRLALAVLIPALLPAVAAEAATLPPVPLRVVTINVLQGVGAPGSGGAVALGRFVTRLDADGAGPNTGLAPDVVCMQECAISPFSDLVNFNNTNLVYPVGGSLAPFNIRSATGDGINFNSILIRPDIAILDHDDVSNAGPRNWVRVTLQVPGALRTLTIYCAHFKAFGDSASMTQRMNEANQLGQNVYNDITLGLDLDDNGSRETPCGDIMIAGDLNSSDNGDGTITGVFTHSVLGVPTGLFNLPVERLTGRIPAGVPQMVTYPSSGSRLDYICLNSTLALPFDANGNGAFPRATSTMENDQAEINAMGFVYYSGDVVAGHAAGQWSNGDVNATTNASDHRPVVFDLRLERDPALPYYPPGDSSQNGALDVEDLYVWEATFFGGGVIPAPDVDGNRNVDLADRDAIKAASRAAETTNVSN